MNTIWGLSHTEAVFKALGICNQDSENIKAGDKDELNKIAVQMPHLIHAYTVLDPDTVAKKLKILESNENTLKEEVEFMLTMFSMADRCGFNHANCKRFADLMAKYQTDPNDSVSLVPLLRVFPDVYYNLKKNNPSIRTPLPEAMKKYKNFKAEHKVEGIFNLLPAGKKYGGFVKAFINSSITGHCEASKETFGEVKKHVEIYIASFRTDYKSTIFSQEKRIEWFEKLQISDADCALWSHLFDQDYPGYQNVHSLFFGQIA